MILVQILDLYSLIVFGAVIISWVRLPPGNPIAGVLYAMTEPLLAPIRRVLPAMGGLDFSPMVLLIAVRVLRGIVVSTVFGF